LFRGADCEFAVRDPTLYNCHFVSVPGALEFADVPDSRGLRGGRQPQVVHRTFFFFLHTGAHAALRRFFAGLRIPACGLLSVPRANRPTGTSSRSRPALVAFCWAEQRFQCRRYVRSASRYVQPAISRRPYFEFHVVTKRNSFISPLGRTVFAFAFCVQSVMSAAASDFPPPQLVFAARIPAPIVLSCIGDNRLAACSPTVRRRAGTAWRTGRVGLYARTCSFQSRLCASRLSSSSPGAAGDREPQLIGRRPVASSNRYPLSTRYRAEIWRRIVLRFHPADFGSRTCLLRRRRPVSTPISGDISRFSLNAAVFVRCLRTT